MTGAEALAATIIVILFLIVYLVGYEDGRRAIHHDR